jgi:hypothetical protein
MKNKPCVGQKKALLGLRIVALTLLPLATHPDKHDTNTQQMTTAAHMANMK